MLYLLHLVAKHNYFVVFIFDVTKQRQVPRPRQRPHPWLKYMPTVRSVLEYVVKKARVRVQSHEHCSYAALAAASTRA